VVEHTRVGGVLEGLEVSELRFRSEYACVCSCECTCQYGSQRAYICGGKSNFSDSLLSPLPGGTRGDGHCDHFSKCIRGRPYNIQIMLTRDFARTTAQQV
jgi:hypothetical protein